MTFEEVLESEHIRRFSRRGIEVTAARTSSRTVDKGDARAVGVLCELRKRHARLGFLDYIPRLQILHVAKICLLRFTSHHFSKL